MWADFFGLATARLKLSPSEFWAMTPMEINVLCDQLIKASPGYVEPVSWEEFDALRRRFPDRPARPKRPVS